MSDPRTSGAANDPDEYDASEEPHPGIDAEGADTDLGTGLQEERERSGDAPADAPLPS